MNWIDNIISIVSPRKGYERAVWRQELELTKNYDAGDYGRLNANWRVLNQSAELTDRPYRDNIRARARDLERNSDIMNSITSTFVRNVIGGGYTLQARTNNEELNVQIEYFWKLWCKKKNCDVTGTQSFQQILRMLVKRKKIDGGILVHKVYTKDGLIPFKLQCLEVDELDASVMNAKEKGNKVVDGIEMNAFNKPVGYWIRQYDIDGLTMNLPKYIPAKDMIYVYKKVRPSQVREISDMTQTMPRIRDTNEFMTAVSVKQRIEACLSVFIKKNVPSGNTIGRGSAIGNEGEKHNYQGKTLTPGMIMNLNPGDEVQTVNPSGQAADASSYIKLQQRMIGAGQGVSYEATSRDMSEANYSSARQGAIEDDLTYEEDKESLLQVMDEIYETFIISLVLSGLIEIKDFWSNKEAYFEHTWIQAPKRWIDPLKESNANKIAMQTGQKTFKQICAENGMDWRECIDEMAAVLEYGKEKNVEIGGVMFGDKYNKQK